MCEIGKKRILAAWAVHGFTALGAVTAILALSALMEGDFRTCLLWLGAAFIIDGLDGPLARKIGVSEATPRFDGAVLDHIIDYLNYTMIPALMVLRFGLVPEGYGLPAAAYMAVTALYCFGNKDMKTKENDFRGFPAIWNLVILFFYITATPAGTNLAVIGLLGLLTFAPIKCVHPLRVVAFRPLTLLMTALWAALSLTLVLAGGPESGGKEVLPAIYGVWLAVSVYFPGLSLWRSVKMAA